MTRIAHAVVVTEAGHERVSNGDAVLRADHLPLYAVADGLGGGAPGVGFVFVEALRDAGVSHGAAFAVGDADLVGEGVEAAHALAQRARECVECGAGREGGEGHAAALPIRAMSWRPMCSV